jgi:transposase
LDLNRLAALAQVEANAPPLNVENASWAEAAGIVAGTLFVALRRNAMPHSRIALETGMHSPWVSRLLSKLGHEVIVAHASKVRLIGESRRKDDRMDAQTLARLARIDPQLLCPVKHRTAKAQADLTVIRARAGLVRTRTALVKTARGLAKSYGERLRGCNVRNMNPEKAEGLSPELQAALEPRHGEKTLPMKKQKHMVSNEFC